jgi:thiosulfate dehydrogenase
MKYASIAWTSVFVAGAAGAIAFGAIAHSLKPDVEITAHPKPQVTKVAASAPAAAAQAEPATKTAFTPSDRAIPDDDFGKVVALGQHIFNNPAKYAKAYVGNELRCASCHLDQGRKAGSAPMWAAYLSYPAYRSKNHHVNTFAERLQGCFRFSMNGKAPPLGDPVLVALETYSYWLAQGAPLDPKIAGRGYTKIAKPAQTPDYHRGEAVYQARCALCHAADGSGQRARNGAAAFPALWGDASFNWGAGMGSVKNAASFIKGNMPLGQGGTLSDQEAWDVAMFIDSHDRPQDPRFTKSVDETRKQFHDSPQSMYGQSVNGSVLGSQSTPNGGALRAAGKL